MTCACKICNHRKRLEGRPCIYPPAIEIEAPATVVAAAKAGRSLLGWIVLAGFVLGLFVAQMLLSV